MKRNYNFISILIINSKNNEYVFDNLTTRNVYSDSSKIILTNTSLTIHTSFN